MPVISPPKVCISVAALAFDTPKSRSMSRRVSRVRSSCSSWLMASGMERSHRGFAGTCRSSAPGGQRAAGRRRERVRAGGVGQDVDPPRDAPVAPPGRLCVRLDVGVASRRRFRAGWRASGSTTAAGAAAATSTASTPAARLGRPRVAASSATSAGRPPDPPGAAAAEAGVPGAKNSPKRRPRGPRRPGRVPLRSRSGPRPRRLPRRSGSTRCRC